MTATTWKEAALGSLAHIRRGSSPRPISSPRWFDPSNDVGWVRISDVAESDGRILLNTRQRLSRDGIARSRQVANGTLIMSIAATVGRPVMTGFETCIHDGFVSFEHLQGVNRDFLYYVLKGLEDSWDAAGQTGSQSNVNTSIVARTLVLLPTDLAEQEAVAAALSAADDLIAAQERLIAKKQAVKHAMMQQLLTGKIRLPGFTDGWCSTRLEEVLSFQVGFPFRSEYFKMTPVGIRLIRNRDLKSNDSPIYYQGEFSNSYVVHPGDVLIGMDGDFAPCRWVSGRALLNQRVGRLRPRRCVADYMYFALQQPLSDLESGTGATTVKHLSHKDVESLVLPLPGIDEQTAIAQALSDTSAEIERLKIRLEKTRAVKTGMMQELLTGRTRLPVKGDAA